MRPWGIVVVALLALALAGASLAAGATRGDRGNDRPPAHLSDDGKSIWMTEWTACWRVTMGRLSNVLHIPVRAGASPQQAAARLAHRAVWLLYETQPETLTAADGCRNGILWRYYHPSG